MEFLARSRWFGLVIAVLVVPAWTAEPQVASQLPDPFAEVAAEYLKLVDKHWPSWDVNEDGKVSVGEVVRGVSACREPKLTALSTEGADENSDRFVTRDEMHRLFEKRLGLRRETGEPLRQPNGLVFNYQFFRRLDTDRNDKVSDHEWQLDLVANGGRNVGLTKFDGDGDGSLSFAEFWEFPGGSLDGMLEFRRLDADLDAHISPAELRTAPEHQRRLAELLIPAFDDDGDRRLSLREYLFTPLALPLLPWWTELADTSDDGRITFGEFTYDNARYPLLRREYFRRFDLNSDGALDAREFVFRTKEPNAFYTINADGTGWRKLFHVPGQRHAGSPTVSPDGSLIAFDGAAISQDRGVPPVLNESRGPQGIFFVIRTTNFEGSALREIGPGLAPSWSPSGYELLVTTEQGAKSMPIPWLGIKGLKIPRSAFVNCPRFGKLSPDGEFVAVAHQNSIEVVTPNGERRKLLPVEANPYKAVGPSVTWSPDSSQIVFVGQTREDLQEIAIVSAQGAELGFQVLFRGEKIRGRFAWRPDGELIVFTMYCPERDRLQLYELNMQGDVRLFPGQDATRNNQYACWMPDGVRLIVISGDFSTPEVPAAGF